MIVNSVFVLNPDPPTLSTFATSKRPVSRVIVFVTVTSTACVELPFVTVTPVVFAPEGENDGVPNVQPVGAVGSVGSVTTQTVPVSNGPIAALAAPATSVTVRSPAPQLYLNREAAREAGGLGVEHLLESSR